MTREEAKAVCFFLNKECNTANVLRGFVTGMACQVDKDMAERCRDVLKVAGLPNGPQDYSCLTPLYNLVYGPSRSSASRKAPLKKRATRAGKPSTSKK